MCEPQYEIQNARRTLIDGMGLPDKGQSLATLITMAVARIKVQEPRQYANPDDMPVMPKHKSDPMD
jgi:hypothetical protein